MKLNSKQLDILREVRGRLKKQDGYKSGFICHQIYFVDKGSDKISIQKTFHEQVRECSQDAQALIHAIMGSLNDSSTLDVYVAAVSPVEWDVIKKNSVQMRLAWIDRMVETKEVR